MLNFVIISTMSESKLSEHKLEYEMTNGPVKKQAKKSPETDKKVVSAVKTTPNKAFIFAKRVFLAIKNDITKRLKAPRKRVINGILGIGLLFVIVSIAYSTYITILFVNNSTSIIALIPQVLFATITLLKAFSKLYK